jgi:hypothetical protein
MLIKRHVLIRASKLIISSSLIWGSGEQWNREPT